MMTVNRHHLPRVRYPIGRDNLDSGRPQHRRRTTCRLREVG